MPDYDFAMHFLDRVANKIFLEVCYCGIRNSRDPDAIWYANALIWIHRHRDENFVVVPYKKMELTVGPKLDEDDEDERWAVEQ